MRMSRVRPLAVIVAALVLTGCFTGERPSFAPEEAAITDPAVVAVIDRLEAANSSQYTATYTILTKLTAQVAPVDTSAGTATSTAAAGAFPTTEAVVAQTSATSRSVTIGNIRFLDQEGSRQTCNLATSTCEAGFVDAQVSDVLVNHDFASLSPADRLRQDAATMVSPGLASTRTIAGQAATCVQVTFAAGTKTYCALDSGLLAFQDTPDLQIDLTSLTAGADPERFTSTTVAG